MFKLPFNALNSTNPRNLQNPANNNADARRLFGASPAFGSTTAFGTGSGFGASPPTSQNKFAFGTTAAAAAANAGTIFSTASNPKLTCTSYQNPVLFKSNGDATKGMNMYSTPFGGMSASGLDRNDQCQGTTVKFSANLVNEHIGRHGTQADVNTRMQNIGGMQEYQSYSFEELREVDYAANRKGGVQGTTSILRNSHTFSQSTPAFASTFQSPPAAFSNCFGANSPVKSSGFNSGMPLSDTNRNSFGTGSAPLGSSFNRNLLGTPSNNFNSPPQQNLPFSDKTAFSPPTQNFTNNTVFSGAGIGSGGNFGRPNLTPGFSFSGAASQTPQSNLFSGGNEKYQPLFPTATTNAFSSPTTNASSSFGAANFNLNNSVKPGGNLFSFQPAGTALPTPGNTGNQGFNPVPIGASNPSYSYQRPPVTNGLGISPISTQSTPPKLFMPPSQNQAPPVLPQNAMNYPTFPQMSQYAYPMQPPNIHSHIIDLAQQFPTPPLLRNLTPIYDNGTFYSEATSPRNIEKALSGYTVTPFNTTKKPLKVHSIVRTAERSMFVGLDEDEMAIENNLLFKKKCPKRLFLPKFEPKPIDNTLEEFTSVLTKGDSDDTPPIDSDDTDSVYSCPENCACPDELPSGYNFTDNTTSLSKSVLAGSLFSRLFCMCKEEATKLVDSVECFPRLTASDDQLRKQLMEKETDASTPDLKEPEPSESLEEIPLFHEHPTGIINTRYGYYTIPSMDELFHHIDRHGKCKVSGFTIGRRGYGNIYFPDKFDVAGINIDETVHFRHKEVTVFADDDNKPPIGEGLNRRAQITLDRVWPTDKCTNSTITDPVRLEEMQFELILRGVCDRNESQFVEYRPETGSWVFTVPHF